MFVVMFEVKIKERCKDEYHQMGKALRASLNEQPGFLGGTSFVSPADPNLELSVNYWESEEALAQWRNFIGHRLSQKAGREKLFERYKITVSQSVRTYTDSDRRMAPQDSNEYHLNQT